MIFYTFVPLKALLCKFTLVMFLQDKFLLLFGVTSLVNRSVTSLGHQGVRIIFWEVPSFLNYVQHIFLVGRKLSRGVLSSVATTKIGGEEKCFISGEKHYFVWDTTSQSTKWL